MSYTRDGERRAYRGLRAGSGNGIGHTAAVPSVQVSDLDLYYELHGAGPPLLMCNGSGATIATSMHLVQRLATEFRVAVHDQRGLGKTGAPGAQPTMADYASDAIALLDHLGWSTARVFGISFGGMVALELAVTAPERIDRLALLCTSAGGAGGSSAPLHELALLPLDERIAVSTRNMDARFTPEYLAEHPFDQGLVDNMVQRMTAPRSDEQLRSERMQLRARAAHDVWDRLDRVTCPTLVACGAFDVQAPPENSEAICRRIASAELHRYEGGHLFAFQDRSAMPEIMTFLGGTTD